MCLGEAAPRAQGTFLGRAVLGSEHVGTLGSLWVCLLALAAAQSAQSLSLPGSPSVSV